MLSSVFDDCRSAPLAGSGRRLFWFFLTLGLLGLSTDLLAHAIAQGDKGYI